MIVFGLFSLSLQIYLCIYLVIHTKIKSPLFLTQTELLPSAALSLDQETEQIQQNKTRRILLYQSQFINPTPQPPLPPKVQSFQLSCVSFSTPLKLFFVYSPLLLLSTLFLRQSLLGYSDFICFVLVQYKKSLIFVQLGLGGFLRTCGALFFVYQTKAHVEFFWI